MRDTHGRQIAGRLGGQATRMNRASIARNDGNQIFQIKNTFTSQLCIYLGQKETKINGKKTSEMMDGKNKKTTKCQVSLKESGDKWGCTSLNVLRQETKYKPG